MNSAIAMTLFSNILYAMHFFSPFRSELFLHPNQPNTLKTRRPCHFVFPHKVAPSNILCVAHFSYVSIIACGYIKYCLDANGCKRIRTSWRTHRTSSDRIKNKKNTPAIRHRFFTSLNFLNSNNKENDDSITKVLHVFECLYGREQ